MKTYLQECITGNPTRATSGSGLADAKEMSRYLAAAGIAALPCLLLATMFFGARVWAMFVTAALAGIAVEISFSKARGRTIHGGGSFVFAAWLALLLPPAVPLWMVALGAAFGALFGKEVFGGTGYQLFNPVYVAKAALLFSFPQIVNNNYFGSMFGMAPAHAWYTGSLVIFLAGIPMLFVRKHNAHIWGSIFFSATITSILLLRTGSFPYDSILQLMTADGFLIGTCILACDPATTPRSKKAIWMYGILIGLLAVLLRAFSNFSEAMISAVLLGNLFAPVFDALANLKSPPQEKGTILP